ncbi:uncharacterized protein LOC107016282 [Solanum pennellii]|uniref:Uncharacterized protein LOC107016282 n=1 Tax=Solanum pennellii TaxID=28526 RepID=A0ABM1GKD9_SOLPN|nr:uncharacterized protein LOC107016282 [Solanum pennellii]
MESAFASASSNSDRRQKIEQYKHILSTVLASSDIQQAKQFIDYMLSDDVALVVYRQLLQTFAQEFDRLEPDVQKEVAHYTLNQIQPRVVSSEEQVLIIREKLAELYESEQQWSKAAQMPSGIDLDSAMRFVDETFGISKCVQIVRLYLEDDDAANAVAFTNKASFKVNDIKNESLNLQYKVCYARILDSKRKFLETVLRYFDISQIEKRLIDDEHSTGFMSGQKEEERQTQLELTHAQGIAGLIVPSNYWHAKYPHLFHPAFGDLKLSQQPALRYHPLSMHDMMKNLKLNELWARTPRDFLGFMKFRLVGKDFVNFTAVCCSFLEAPLMPWITDFSDIRFLTIESATIQMFNPFRNIKLFSSGPQVPKLLHSELLCAKGHWLLIGNGHDLFFFNATSHMVISLPNRLDKDNIYRTNWTFIGTPDSSDCFVIGVEFAGSPPAVYLTKVGEKIWHYHELFDNHVPDGKIVILVKFYNPVIFGNSIYLVGEEDDLAILTLEESSAERPNWYFFWNTFTFEEQENVKRVYGVEDSDGDSLIIVCCMDAEPSVNVWRYTVTDLTLVRERLLDLNGNTMFVSSGSAYLKQCSEVGFENKIFFPLLHGDHNSVFFCLKAQKFFSYDYSTQRGVSNSDYLHIGKPISGVWIDDDFVL